MLPPGSLSESLGNTLEFPNIARADGTWGNFYWQMRGNTPLGAAVWLELVSFDVPDSYVLPATWPAKNTLPSSLLMYFGSDFNDSSPIAHTITEHNVTLQTDGGAHFDGSSSYLSFDGSDSSLSLAGDFTIEVTIAPITTSLQNNSQPRILSFGSAPSLGIGIDPTKGSIILLNEFTSVLNNNNTGGVRIPTNSPTTVKWSRAGSVNTLSINGQQDGPPFTDTTTWTATASSEIGRLNGQNAGYFSGTIYNINIVKGAAF